MATGVGIDPARIAQLTEREEAHLNSETSGSARMYERSRKVMPMGVPSSYQARSPHPIFLERGVGSKVWDVDGSRVPRLPQRLRLDGAGPRAPRDHARRRPSACRSARHFAAMTEDSVVVAEELARRWGLPKWRFTNSGSESTMDAIRLARAAHRPRARGQDGGLLPRPPRHRDGLDRRSTSTTTPSARPTARTACPTAAASPPAPSRRRSRCRSTTPTRSTRAWPSSPGQVACVIMEPGMMNIGVVLPQDGYLAAGARDHAEARRPPDLRRGQDRHHDRRRRRGRALRRHARHRHAREGARRRPAERRDRRQRGGHGARSRTASSTRSAPTTATR